MTSIVIAVTGIEDISQRIKDLNADHAVCRSVGVMSGETAKMAAVSAAQYHIGHLLHRQAELFRPRRIVTEEDLAALDSERRVG